MHIHRAQGVRGEAAALRGRLWGEQFGKGQYAVRQRLRLAGVMGGTGNPSQCFAHRRQAVDQARLGDGHMAITVGDEVTHLLGRGAGVGGDCNRPQLGAGTPGEQEFRAVFQMDQHPIPAAHAEGFHGNGNTPDGIVELGVGIALGGAVEGFPDQQWLVAMRLSLGGQ
ncbi:hypothetical protein D3C76_570820 [compost metagenome]